MKNHFKDKVVIVTGASSGIGKETASEFARNGSKVVLASRSLDRIRQLESELLSENHDVIAIQTDVSREEQSLLVSRGSLVGVSSVAGFHGLPGRSGYSASKFAMHGFLETIRIENLKKGLHVMIIAPGFTATEIRKHALLSDGSEQGESPLNEDKLMSPTYVARWILKGIVKNKRNKILTWEGRLTALFQRIIPHTIDRAYYNALAREKNSPLKQDWSE